MDGVVADMDAELLRQAEIVFGRPRAQQPQRPADPVSATPPETSSPEQAAAEAAPDNGPPQLRLNLTSRQQRRLWHHVEGIENFWQTLDETELGIVARLPAAPAGLSGGVSYSSKRAP